jgi:hypothetical protein
MDRIKENIIFITFGLIQIILFLSVMISADCRGLID